MTYPNATNGIKKIFTAEILCLVGTVVLLISGFLAAVSIVAAASTGDANTAAGAAFSAGLGMLTVALIGSIVVVVGGIMALIGLINASKDQKYFKYALYAIIVSIVFTGVAGYFSANPSLQSVLNACGSSANLISTIFVIQAIIDIANGFNNADVAARGKSQLTLIVVIQVLSIIASLVVSFMGGQFASVVAAVIAIISVVLSLIQYVLYLLLLSKAKAMLETN